MCTSHTFAQYSSTVRTEAFSAFIFIYTHQHLWRYSFNAFQCFNVQTIRWLINDNTLPHVAKYKYKCFSPKNLCILVVQWQNNGRALFSLPFLTQWFSFYLIIFFFFLILLQVRIVCDSVLPFLSECMYVCVWWLSKLNVLSVVSYSKEKRKQYRFICSTLCVCRFG